jgi:1,4-alpha-glucan branching enzyme
MTSALTRLDRHLFHEGTYVRAYEKLGAHRGRVRGKRGFWFATWAPGADKIDVVGDMNDWTEGAHPLTRVSEAGLWQGFVPGAAVGQRYKFRLVRDGSAFFKADPYAFATEGPPETASVITEPTHTWNDAAWMAGRTAKNALDAPISVYELHPGSWRRPGGHALSWRALAAPLIQHLRATGFTHVELMPVMEHPFYGSWGYQVTSYFAPTARHGYADDLAYLIDELHQAGFGVFLDWVPAHFPSDDFSLARFDGGPLYEHADPRRGHHPDWDTSIFDYGRPEVRSFLLSSALFWLDRFHADGLRVDAVASMLYLDYSREDGEWSPNEHGGNEHLEAIEFLRSLNTAVYTHHPGVQTIAEESTAWPLVSRPVWDGGLGFGLKWDMGWMHDTLAYLAEDPLHRAHHHDKLTFRGVYAWAENFVLPLSHDEVVHGKGSLLNKMPGDPWQKRANLRLLFAQQWATSGKKLLFMGCELGQLREWAHERELDWELLEDPDHAGIMALVSRLNQLYRTEPALHRGDCVPAGFGWIDGSDSAASVLAVRRLDPTGEAPEVVIVAHFTPVVRGSYRIGVPHSGLWRVMLETDATEYGGSGVTQGVLVPTEAVAHHGHPQSLVLTLPPLGAVWLRAPDPA